MPPPDSARLAFDSDDPAPHAADVASAVPEVPEAARPVPVTPEAASPPTPPTPPTRRRSIVGLVVLGLLILVVAATAWVGVRGLQAKDALEAAVPLASTIQDQILAGNGEQAAQTAADLAEFAAIARSRTSDPIWRGYEFLPFLGPNLTAVRELAVVVDDVAQNAVTPLAGLAGTLDLNAFKPIDGSIALQPLLDAQPPVKQASTALARATENVNSIDTDSVLAVVREAVTRLQTVTEQTSSSLNAMDRAVTLLPAMLGASEPRDYILLFQNLAELRATGGIPGALALVHTDQGSVELTQQATAEDFDPFAAPVLPLGDDTTLIYGDITGEYIQNVSLTPDFAQTGALAREMWRLQFGLEANGVLSIDPVALSYLLDATGPITLATGDELTADNAVSLLLRDVYARYDDLKQQDIFFAAAAGAVFDAVKSGRADPTKLISALARAGAEHRVLVWNADEAEQAVLDDTTLVGGRPVSDESTNRFGLYLNDLSGAKMDFYLDVETAIGQQTCRTDRRPQYTLEVTVTNTAPADAATSLPIYVTGRGISGVPLGNIKTQVSAYGVPRMYNLGVTRDGVAAEHVLATDASYPVTSLVFELAPGESTVLLFNWLGAAPFSGDLELRSTPLVALNDTASLDFSC
ncbi:DUF4012 domain-containing protein [Cryobacterium sp. TMS1-20-1]|uniref:DUF4012 domain-containing protein n=1 Tax=Cryobacterium sp. TMS1-20-1 TaxID=1259223 RepID=UPI001069B847|nr:DUF4012 domain-containing protein [Cryobacterium sp. TMS1-20-1]TFC76704.1 DUF4012 domain-containing protein [Cryobacterium sp. TMS1-20-1]